MLKIINRLLTIELATGLSGNAFTLNYFFLVLILTNITIIQLNIHTHMIVCTNHLLTKCALPN